MKSVIQLAFLFGTIAILSNAANAEIIQSYPAGGGQYHENMQPFLATNYVIALQGTYPSQNGGGASTMLGEVTRFGGYFAPSGWAYCDGQLLPIAQNSALFSLLGTMYGGDGQTTFALPDLRGRAPLHEGNGPGLTSRSLGAKLGDEQVLLNADQLPPHNHTMSPPADPTTGITGSGQPHTNMPPSLPLNFNIATQGIYPSRNGGGGNGDLFVGEVRMFAGNFTPGGRASTDGQLLPIAQNSALFSLLGTMYGGDGQTTFALPELRGRTPIHAGNGPGLISRTIGQRSGYEEVTLTPAQLPSHDHSLPSPHDPTGNNGSGQAHANMQPFLATNHIIALTGNFPSHNSGWLSENFIGEIGQFAGNFAPGGWALCDGQLLPINQNQALFSILGTTYGGDGQTTFALPDLRGRTAIHRGTGPGLSSYNLGRKGGLEAVVLTEAAMASHTHSAVVPEPGTLMLVLIGLIGLLPPARRRR